MAIKETYTCTSCNAVVDEDASHCPQCGEAFDGFEYEESVSYFNNVDYDQKQGFDSVNREAYIRFAFFPIRLIVTAIGWGAYLSPLIGLVTWIFTGSLLSGFLIFAILLLIRIIGMIILSPLLMIRAKYPGLQEEGEIRQGFLNPDCIPVELLKNCPVCNYPLEQIKHFAHCPGCSKFYLDKGFEPTIFVMSYVNAEIIDSYGKKTGRGYPIQFDNEYESHFKANPIDDNEEPFKSVIHWHEVIDKQKNEKFWNKQKPVLLEFINYLNAKRLGENDQERYLKASRAVWLTIKGEADLRYMQLMEYFFTGFPSINPIMNKFFMMTIFTDGYALRIARERVEAIKTYNKIPNLWDETKLRSRWYEILKKNKLSKHISACIFALSMEIGKEIYLALNPDGFILADKYYEIKQTDVNNKENFLHKFERMSANDKIIYFKKNQLLRCQFLANNLLAEGYFLRKAELSLLKKYS